MDHAVVCHSENRSELQVQRRRTGSITPRAAGKHFIPGARGWRRGLTLPALGRRGAWVPGLQPGEGETGPSRGPGPQPRTQAHEASLGRKELCFLHPRSGRTGGAGIRSPVWTPQADPGASPREVPRHSLDRGLAHPQNDQGSDGAWCPPEWGVRFTASFWTEVGSASTRSEVLGGEWGSQRGFLGGETA